MIYNFLGLCTVSSSWIPLSSLSRRLLHSCLWEEQHLLLIPAFNPSNPPAAPWFRSYIPFSGFQSSSPAFSFYSNPRCSPILCKDQADNFPASSTLSHSHFCPLLCSMKGTVPLLSLCNSSLWAPPGLFLPSNFCNGLQPFFSWFYEHLEVLKWIQFPSAWMAQNQIFLLYTKRQMCVWCLWRLPLFRDLLLECWGMIKNLRSSKNITRISADSTYISVLTTST